MSAVVLFAGNLWKRRRRLRVRFLPACGGGFSETAPGGKPPRNFGMLLPSIELQFSKY
jgi:hypothetical protein